MHDHRIHPVVYGLQGVLCGLLQLGFIELCRRYAILCDEELASIVPLTLCSLVHPGSRLRCRLEHAAELHRLSSEPCFARAPRCDIFRRHDDDAPWHLWRHGNRWLKLQPSTWRRTSWREGRGGKWAKERRRLRRLRRCFAHDDIWACDCSSSSRRRRGARAAGDHWHWCAVRSRGQQQSRWRSWRWSRRRGVVPPRRSRTGASCSRSRAGASAGRGGRGGRGRGVRAHVLRLHIRAISRGACGNPISVAASRHTTRRW